MSLSIHAMKSRFGPHALPSLGLITNTHVRAYVGINFESKPVKNSFFASAIPETKIPDDNIRIFLRATKRENTMMRVS